MNTTRDTKILNSVVETYDAIAESWDQVRRRPAQIWNVLLPFIQEGDAVLDVGCGNGRLAEFLMPKNVRYTGVDSSMKLIEIAGKRYAHEGSGARFVVADMQHLPFADSSFEVVNCLAAFHHLPSVDTRIRALEEMRRVTRPGGRLLLTNWNLYHTSMLVRFRLWSLLRGRRDVSVPWKLQNGRVFQRYYYSYLLRELNDLLVSSGWRVEESRYINNQGPAHFWNGLFSFIVASRLE